MATSIVIALDPGREKCGLAAVDEAGAVLERAIVPRDVVVQQALALVDRHGAALLVLGNSTQSREVHTELQAARPALKVELVDERNSTFEARSHYWVANPPRGWRKMVPLSMQAPPEPLDDWAAVVLAGRFFAWRAGGPAG